MAENKSPFHRGEQEIQSRLGVRERVEGLGQRMINEEMSEGRQAFFAQLPLLVVGTADETGRPWASALLGAPGFVRASDSRTLAVGARPVYGDPLNRALVEGRDIGTLGLEFPTRRRIRVNGRITGVGEDGFSIRVTQSYGNCPQYIQAREPDLGEITDAIAAMVEQRAVRRGEALDKAEAALIARSDTFFIASQFTEGSEDWSQGIDVSHRGGRPGFVIVAHETSLLFPDYSGNCMFNTLGNISLNPRCGLLFIDFESGDTLQLTGEAEILWEPHHIRRFAGAERVVAFRVEETLHIDHALPIPWEFLGYSPVFDDFEPVEDRPPPKEPVAPMKLLSINVSCPKEIIHEGKTVTTGIFKQPLEGRTMLRWLNLEGDGQADLWGHGGAFRAVYVYGKENYAFWESELGRDDMSFGEFGENFTVEGMLDDQVCVGDLYRIGGALVEISQPRVPCYKLAIKMGIEGFQNRFLESGRIGFYFRVLEEGEVGAGDSIELVSRDPREMTVREISDLLYFDKSNLEATEKALSIPALSHGWKQSFEERLAKAASVQRQTGFRTFVVDQKVPESETVMSFYLVPADGEPLPEFKPGQFLTFELKIPGQSEAVIRTYSLSDSPNPDYYRVSIKREPAPAEPPGLPAGLASNYLHDDVATGAELEIGAPRGKFCLDPNEHRAVVLLAGGVGFTPLLSMLNTLVRSGSQRPVWFIHGVRDSHEHALAEHVRRLSERLDNVHVHIRYSRPGPEDVKGFDYDSEGHVDIALLKELLPFDDYEFYLCGPTAFMRSLHCGLLATGVSDSRIHYEFFGPASVLYEAAEPAGQAPARSAREELSEETEVTFSRSGVSATWQPACESILDLAEHHGLNPPYSCRSGICHTCECALTEGEVEYFEEPLDAPEPGRVLICVARPKGKVTVDV